MKCPKCKYTSFDYLDACRKCGADLRDSRSVLQIIAVSPEERAPVFPRAGIAPPTADQGVKGYAVPFASDVGASADFAAPVDPGEGVLGDLNFDQSFEDMVVPASRPSGAGTGDASPLSPKDDELLDLDFGDVFGEKGKS